MATGSMFEGVYVCLVRRAKRGDFEPCLTKVKLMLGQNFLLDLPYHLFRRRGEQLRNHHAAIPGIVLGGEQ